MYDFTQRAGTRLLTVLWLFVAQALAAPGLDDYQDEPQVTARFDSPAFTLSYPADWAPVPTNAPTLLQAEAPGRLPALRVLVLDEPFWLPLQFATRAAKTALESQGRDIRLISETVEQWGELQVNVGEVHWIMDMGLGLPLRSLFVSTFHDGRWIIVNLVTGTGAGEFPEHLRQIARTLRITGSGG